MKPQDVIENKEYKLVNLHRFCFGCRSQDNIYEVTNKITGVVKIACAVCDNDEI